MAMLYWMYPMICAWLDQFPFFLDLRRSLLFAAGPIRILRFMDSEPEATEN
jgi:hypothetical protein